VTVVYDGHLAHRDTAGHDGSIGPGDVQWMTAGAGLRHAEMYDREFARRGGKLELLQLWVNMPKADKLVAPKYQELRAAAIPSVPLPGNKGSIRVIAGSYGGATGPADTFSPITLLDLQLAQGADFVLTLPAAYNVGLYVVRGAILVNGDRPAKTQQLVVLGWNSTDVQLTASEDSLVLVLAGAPIEEPLATYGPFVMNTNEELMAAIADFESGNMGKFPEDE
jgi:redox-sensitive bicupin YhaK (pirin superfamily)